MRRSEEFRPVVLDTGVLIALESPNRRVGILLERAREIRQPVVIPTGVLAQAWRDGARQVKLARLIKSPHVQVIPLSDRQARAAGELCGQRGTDDVIDASVVVVARLMQAFVATSDPEDIGHLDGKLLLYPV